MPCLYTLQYSKVLVWDFPTMKTSLSVTCNYMVIDQERGQDGWIFTKFFFACLWTEMESGSINLQEKNEADIQQYWPNNLGP